ncbi:hypothetical protein I4U23_010808 [Adineta vaga]|nr:hypothetical protein I4U23_010808 [Adineta vaga]
MGNYPSTYINTQFTKFFTEHISSSSITTTLLPLFIDENQLFLYLRQKLLNQLTVKQKIVAKRVDTVDIVNDDHPNDRKMDDIPSRKLKINIKQNNEKFTNTIFIHFIHEARLKDVRRDVHRIHDNLFKNTPNEDIRLIAGHRNSPNIERELTRKRPSLSLLKNEEPKTKYQHKTTNMTPEICVNQSLIEAEKIAQTYTDSIRLEITKLLNVRGKVKDLQAFDRTIEAIQQRQTNMIRRASYNTKQKLKILLSPMCTTPNS